MTRSVYKILQPFFIFKPQAVTVTFHDTFTFFDTFLIDCSSAFCYCKLHEGESCCKIGTNNKLLLNHQDPNSNLDFSNPPCHPIIFRQSLKMNACGLYLQSFSQKHIFTIFISLKCFLATSATYWQLQCPFP